ncbi:Diphthamide biosynthesis protein 4 [Pichia kudriavzevii]|uniref:Diphthamide biosynthesis protein 4 n=1 Tax=Pichia kudriavzevii TaxID=4909 RepID=A0A1V2LUS7_PICKU|nr:Diphthamide biosynthesis protein 4 [Pichia kudriavzevii]
MTLHANHVSFYEILGVSKDAERDSIKTAYHRLLLTNHPDKSNPNANTYSIPVIQQAYRTLINDDERIAYDKQLHDYYIKLGLVDSMGIDTDGIDHFDLSEFVEDGERFVHDCPRCQCHEGFQVGEQDLENGVFENNKDNEEDEHGTHINLEIKADEVQVNEANIVKGLKDKGKC